MPALERGFGGHSLLLRIEEHDDAEDNEERQGEKE
jgi:hypothetical protein